MAQIQPYVIGPVNLLRLPTFVPWAEGDGDNYTVDTDPPVLRSVLAKNLADFMAKSADLQSQMALGRRSGVAQATIGRVLRGEAAATVDTLESLARALGVSPHLLIHPDPQFAATEAEFYARMRRLFDQQPK